MTARVLFEGGYAINSAGDDAPLAFLTSALRDRLDGEVEFEVICRHPNARFDAVHGVRSRVGIEYGSRAEAAGRWLRGTNPGEDPEPLHEVVNAIEQADLLVLGAGNFVNERGMGLLRGLLPRFTLLASIASTVRTPVMLYGLSASPLHSRGGRLAAQALVDHADVVTFREERAVELLVEAGVELPTHHVLPDPALGAPEPRPGRAAEVLGAEGVPARAAGRRLALAPRDLSFDDRYLDVMADTTKLIDAWLGEDRHNDVLVISQCTYEDSPATDDRTIGRALADAAADPDRVHVLEAPVEVPAEVEACYETADLVVATRLHGSVFAARRGVPVIGLAYEDKVTGFFRSLGLPELALDPGTPVGQLLAAVDHVSAEEATIRAHLSDRVPQLRDAAQTYVDLALGLLDR